MSLKEMKGIINLGGKNICNKAKLFPPLEEPARKTAFKILVKTDEQKMIKFSVSKKHEFKSGSDIIIIRIGNNRINKRS